MSLLSAAEEERLEILKILEQSSSSSSRHQRASDAGSYTSPLTPTSTNSMLEPPLQPVSSMLDPEYSPMSPPETLSPKSSVDSSGFSGSRVQRVSSNPPPRPQQKSSSGGFLSNLFKTSSSRERRRSSSSFPASHSPPPPSSVNGLSPSSSYGEPGSFHHAYRHLSDANILRSGSTLASSLPRSGHSPSDSARLAVDIDDEVAVSDDDDEWDSSSDYGDDDRDNSDSDDSTNEGLTSDIVKSERSPMSLLAAAEDERKSISTSHYRVRSLLESNAPRPSVVVESKRRVVHPKTAFDPDTSFMAPYTSDTEEALGIKKAAVMDLTISLIESNNHIGRALRTVTRGNYAQEAQKAHQRRSYLVAEDLSPESRYALEWTIGTVLRDGNVMYAIYAVEEREDQDPKLLEEERLEAINKITNQIVRLLKKTPLQVHVVIEVIHCKSPKHLITEMVNYINPSLVVLGSRGRSAIKGILLGSFSNYLVSNSSVPVMVARRRLKKSKHRSANIKFSNNLRETMTKLSEAKVD